MLEQCCDHPKQCRNDAATLCCAKNRRWESSRVKSPLNIVIMVTSLLFFLLFLVDLNFPAAHLHPEWGGGVGGLLSKKLMEMCGWMGSHYQGLQ